MTSNEAHAYTLGIVENLRARGIPTFIKPYPEERKTAKILRGSASSVHASPSAWCSVRFNATEIQSEIIWNEREKLNAMGIRFDTGGTDWELDWSFSFCPYNVAQIDLGKPSAPGNELEMNWK
jgi:hypothetical protein